MSDKTDEEIEVGDLVLSLDNGHLGLVKSVFWADGEPYEYGPYIVVIWVDVGFESCWISHHHFTIVSKARKNNKNP